MSESENSPQKFGVCFPFGEIERDSTYLQELGKKTLGGFSRKPRRRTDPRKRDQHRLPPEKLCRVRCVPFAARSHFHDLRRDPPVFPRFLRPARALDRALRLSAARFTGTIVYQRRDE